MAHSGGGAAWRQLVAGLLASLQAMSAGAIIGWDPVGGPVDGPWRRPGDTWLPSLASLGAVVGAAPAGWLADLAGRKAVLVAAAVPGVLGWALVLLADSSNTQTTLLYAGRFVSGLSVGAVLVAASMYNIEVASTKRRGAVGSLLYLMYAGGIMWARALAASTLPLIAASSQAGLALLMMLAPESPTYLVRRGKTEAAEAALARLGIAEPPRAALELRELIAHRPTPDGLFRVGVVVLGLMSFQQMVGSRAVAALSRLVFPPSWSTVLPPTLALAVSSVAGALLPAAAGDGAGRKALLICSAAAMTVCHLVLSLFLFVRASHPGQDFSGITWLPVVAALVHGAAFGAGFGTVPWVVVAELAPPASRGAFVSGAVCAGRVLALVFARAYYGSPGPVEHPEMSLVFCCSCCLAILFVALFVPETRSRSSRQLLALLQ